MLGSNSEGRVRLQGCIMYREEGKIVECND